MRASTFEPEDPGRKMFSARHYLFLKLSSHLSPRYFCKSCPLQWKETGEDVPHCDGLQQLWYEHWCRLLCLGFAVLSFWLPVWVLCPSLAGILFAASHSSSQIKVESLLPHPMLKWNVLCKSFAFPWAETLFYLSHQERELLQPHCPTEPVGFQTQ